jgi:alginate O-acetyltransferase complex protein AlgI
VIGLWHGARWTYVAFGLTQGIWYILEVEVRSSKRWKAFANRTPDMLRLRAGQIFTFVPLVISLAIFRSQSLQDFAHLMGSLAGDWHSSAGTLLRTKWTIINLAWAFAICWLCPNTYEFLRNYKPGILTWKLPSTTPRWMSFSWHPTLLWALAFFVLGFMVIGALGVPTPFDYGGF